MSHNKKIVVTKELVAADIDNELAAVDVPHSIMSRWDEDDLVEMAHNVAKENRAVTGIDPVKQFAKSAGTVKVLTPAEATAQIAEMLLSKDPTTGAAVYGTGLGADTEYFERSKKSTLKVEYDAHGNLVTAVVRGVKITPKGKIHYLCQGDTEFARDLREYMITCTKRVEELKNECAAYESALNTKNEECIDQHADIKKVLMHRHKMSEDDAKGVCLQVDKMVTFPLLLGNGKGNKPEENGIHYGTESVKNAGAAAKTVQAMPGTVTKIAVDKKGRVKNCSAGLNLLAKTQQKETRQSICSMFKHCKGAVTKPRAIKLLKRYRNQHSTKFLELDPNSDDETAWLSADEQAKAKFDSREDRMIESPEPLVAIPATPVWAAQQGLR